MNKNSAARRAVNVGLTVLLVAVGLVSALRIILATVNIRSLEPELGSSMYVVVDWMIFAVPTALVLLICLGVDLWTRSLGLWWIVPAALHAALTLIEWPLMRSGAMDTAFAPFWVAADLLAANAASAGALYYAEKRRAARRAERAADGSEAGN